MKLPKGLEKVLSEKDQQDIKAEFDKQVQIAVESALHQYDDEAIKRIEALVEQINESHKVQLMNLMKKRKAIDLKKRTQLQESYNDSLIREANRFKMALASNIERFIEAKVSNIVNYSTIKKAARNNTARIVLEGLRKQLGVDSALMRESISAPIMEGKRELEKCRSYIRRLKEENVRLCESLNNSEANLLVENKVASLNEDAADYMRRMLKGKDIKFINEQFGYILGLYQDNQRKRIDFLREQAMSKVQHSPKRITEPKHKRDLIKSPRTSKRSEDDLLMDEILKEMNETV
jgi:cation transport regulator ChaB